MVMKQPKPLPYGARSLENLIAVMVTGMTTIANLTTLRVALPHQTLVNGYHVAKIFKINEACADLLVSHKRVVPAVKLEALDPLVTQTEVFATNEVASSPRFVRMARAAPVTRH